MRVGERIVHQEHRNSFTPPETELPPPLTNKPITPLVKSQVLEKRANAKYHSVALAKKLIALNSPMKHVYIRTLNCARQVNATDMGDSTKYTSHYCGNKSCFVCNKIRTGKMINKYLDLTNYLKDSHFVTLTIRNIEYKNRTQFITDTKDMYRKMTVHFRKIQDMLNRKGIKLKGVRNFECIPTQDCNGSRPHIHWLIDGDIDGDALLYIWKKQKLPMLRLYRLLTDMWEGKITAGAIKGELIVQLWLKAFPDITDRKGQDVRASTEGSQRELFKYTTKVLIQNKNGDRLVPIHLLDCIYEATQGVRAIQVTGFTIKQPKPLYLSLKGLKREIAFERFKEVSMEYQLYTSLTDAMNQGINEGLEATLIVHHKEVVDESTGEIVTHRPAPESVFLWRGDNWYFQIAGNLYDSTPLCEFAPSGSNKRFLDLINSS